MITGQLAKMPEGTSPARWTVLDFTWRTMVSDINADGYVRPAAFHGRTPWATRELSSGVCKAPEFGGLEAVKQWTWLSSCRWR
ncbi:hypothetical protein GCM10010353_30150 [Streptomyces chryseus]|uniref:Uncharacterized protein n=1 Tax=Streptomyces chryseus TaxID=68186 RepID=A0ABQ3DE81_9ACTN|nr:hypothetical protein GCM10010353_30150 [Streptomyces chryseus]GHA86553.1 hypothetical protein GCM10010346_06450 [Streptomyces chryseus]